MWDIHRKYATSFSHAARAPASRSRHSDHTRRRLLLEPLESRALLSLTTWTVNSLGDSRTGTGTSGDLRYVITQADQTQGDNTINFAVTGTITLNSALPDLSNTTGVMDIEGPGAASLTVARSSAAPEFSVFTVDAIIQAQLAGLTITGGSASSGGGIDNAGTLTLTNSTIADNSNGYGGDGGGIFNDGTMTITNSTIADNSAGYVRDGGGIFNDGTMTITNSTIADNSASYGGVGDGGGIDNEGTLTVANSTIDNNGSQFGGGGGIYNGGTVTVSNSTIADNSTGRAEAAYGGGGIANAGTMTLIDSTVSGNGVTGISSSPSYEAGAGGDAQGGGIWSSETLTIMGCTIAGNQVNGGTGFEPGQAEGGGIWAIGSLQVSDSTISGNSATGGENAALLGARPIPPSGPAGSADGGGLYLQGTASITNVTISGNNADGGPGGGLVFYEFVPPVGYESVGFDGGFAAGGGVEVASGSLALTNSTISGNRASGGNGGLGEQYPYPYILAPSGVDGQGGSGNGGGIDGSGLSSATVVNCIVAGNSVSGGLGGGTWIINSNNNLYYVVPDTRASSGFGDISNLVSSASAYNLIGTGGSGGLVNGSNGNQVGVADPGLDPRGLQNNGGPTQTIALVTGSPAIDAGSNALAVDPITGKHLTTDQRGTGFPRIANGTVDIGAYEVQSYITAVAVGWGTQTAALETASDGLRLLPAGRNTDLPWLGIDKVQLTLTQAATLAAGDITVIGSSGINYGPVTVSGSGTSYTINLAQPINTADRVTITIGNDLIAPFTRRLDVLPGDVNDDGIVNSLDLGVVRNQIVGITPETIWADLDGTVDNEGNIVVDMADYLAVKKRIGSSL